VDIGLLNFYQEGTSLKWNSSLLQQLIFHWDHVRHGFKVSLDLWYRPMEEDVYFIIGLSRRGEYFPHFPALPLGVARETQLEYV
jgi:hypothetical protein